MTIERQNKWVEFDSIKIGEVFIDEEQDIAMKTESKFYENGYAYNAVNLETGEFLYIADGKAYKVKPIKCRLVIE